MRKGKENTDRQWVLIQKQSIDHPESRSSARRIRESPSSVQKAMSDPNLYLLQLFSITMTLNPAVPQLPNLKLKWLFVYHICFKSYFKSFIIWLVSLNHNANTVQITLYKAWHKSVAFWLILQWGKVVTSLAVCPVENTVIIHCMSHKAGGIWTVKEDTK